MLGAGDTGCRCESIVFPRPQRLAGEFDTVIRLDAFSLKAVAIPGIERHDRNSQDEAVADFEARSAQDLPGSSCPYNCGEFVLVREASDGFRRARGVLIDQQDNPAVKGLRAEAFRHHHDGLVGEGVSEREAKKLDLA